MSVTLLFGHLIGKKPLVVLGQLRVLLQQPVERRLPGIGSVAELDLLFRHADGVGKKQLGRADGHRLFAEGDRVESLDQGLFAGLGFSEGLIFRFVQILPDQVRQRIARRRPALRVARVPR